ncbi:MAG TPA: hypothetical protein VNG51_26010, partial [Ktedonobacteraceae bacterium]|nr:hypothetical protein [Ktedonobacteraceae bacterium]
KAWALARFIGTNVNNVVQLGMIVGGPEGEEAVALEEGTTTAIEEGTAVVEGGSNAIADTVEGGSTSATSDTVTLYRAVDQKEFNDVLRYGDYNLSPHGGGKYFSFTEEGTQQFANSSFNAGRNMTVTSIDVPRSTLESMIETGDAYPFFDSGGGNESIHIADEALPDFYEAMGLPQILDAPWVLAL